MFTEIAALPFAPAAAVKPPDLEQVLEARYPGYEVCRRWKNDRGANPNYMTLAAAALNLAQRAPGRPDPEEAARLLVCGHVLETPRARFSLAGRRAS